MPNPTKAELAEEFKAALKQKEAEEAKKRIDGAAQELRRQHSNSENKKRLVSKKRQMELEKLEADIAHYEAELDKYRKIIARDSFGLVGDILLGIFLVFITILLVLFLAGIDRTLIIMTMVVALLILIASIVAHLLPVLAEKKLRDNSVRLKKARIAFFKLRDRR